MAGDRTKALASQVQDLCVSQKLKVAFAESCTGGALASAVTAIPGASDYFLGSFVVYSNEMKEHILGVDAQLLVQRGAVSQEVVLAMLAGVFAQAPADVAVAISGVPGPSGGTVEKPVGMVWVALGRRGHAAKALCLQLSGSRGEVIGSTVQRVLEELLKV